MIFEFFKVVALANSRVLTKVKLKDLALKHNKLLQFQLIKLVQSSSLSDKVILTKVY